MEVIYEDNHIIIVNKEPGEIVQGDKTGDEPLVETVRRYIKENMPNRAMFSAVSFTASTVRSTDWLCLPKLQKHSNG